jgi:hypothetical protein
MKRLFTSLCRSPRLPRGSTLFELPILLFFVFIVVALPLLGLATLAYRDALFSFAVKNAASEAAKAPSFHAAQAVAAAKVSQGCGAFTGIAVSNCQVSIVCKSLTTAVETEHTAPLNPASIDSHANLYFVKVCANGLISPMVGGNGTSYWSFPIPGFTVPYPLKASCEVFFERPKGLST